VAGRFLAGKLAVFRAVIFSWRGLWLNAGQ
jgi:hypothetical protein